MTIERLREFALMASTLNFSDAGRILFLSQSTLSRHIGEMEEELGFKLFTRTTRNVMLTKAGRQFSYSVPQILEKYESAISRITVNKLKATGTIKIAYSDSTAVLPFLGFCKKFSDKYRDITLNTVSIPDEELAYRLGDFDIAFSYTNFTGLGKNMRQYSVFRQSAVLFLPLSHKLVYEPFSGLRALSGETVFLMDDNENGGPYSQCRSALQRITGGKANIVDVPNVQTALINVSMGKGCTICPIGLVHEDYLSFSALKIPEIECSFNINVYFDIERNSPAMALFLNELLPGGAVDLKT
ncbi:MAG: LysR family transcriptional regulator [Oscillospiraceae bacterium]